MQLCQLPTSILEQPVLHNELVVLQGLRVHFVVFILVRQIEQHLKVTELLVQSDRTETLMAQTQKLIKMFIQVWSSEAKHSGV